MLEDALRQELLDNAAVAALVVDRVYPQIAQQGSPMPYIVFQRISSGHAHHLRAAAGLCQTRIQIDCYGDPPTGGGTGANLYSGAKTLADKVRLALDGQLAGTLGSGSYTAGIRSIALENEIDGFDDPSDGGQQGTHRVIQDYIIWHSETVPTFA